jgi:hypothetical protein
MTVVAKLAEYEEEKFEKSSVPNEMALPRLRRW